MTSTHEFDETSVCSDELSLSLKIENRSSYGGIISNFNDDQSLTDYSANKSNQKEIKKIKLKLFRQHLNGKKKKKK